MGDEEDPHEEVKRINNYDGEEEKKGFDDDDLEFGNKSLKSSYRQANSPLLTGNHTEEEFKDGHFSEVEASARSRKQNRIKSRYSTRSSRLKNMIIHSSNKTNDEGGYTTGFANQVFSDAAEEDKVNNDMIEVNDASSTSGFYDGNVAGTQAR